MGKKLWILIVLGILGTIFIIGENVKYRDVNSLSSKSKNILLNTQTVITTTSDQNIINISNNVVLQNNNVQIYLGNTSKMKLYPNEYKSENIGVLRKYILSWYNDGHQFNNYNKNVKYVVPPQNIVDQLFSFNMTNQEKLNFLNTYGNENIMISVETGGIGGSDNQNIKPIVLINGTPAYGFAVFNNNIMASGKKLFYYGFITADGVVIAPYELNIFGKRGLIEVIRTHQKIDFVGSNNGQYYWLV
ncbi:MAG: hypothetical protein ACRC41_12645 [Sarcina sp.]